MRKFLTLWGFLLALQTMFAPAVWAHEGHDHGDSPPQVVTTAAPRADASSQDFELVVIARGDQWRIFLDTFRGNEPVVGAEIEIDTPRGLLRANAEADAVYVVSAPWLAQPGQYDLAITVQANGLVDILTANLTIPAPAPPGPAASGLLTSVRAATWVQDVRRHIVRNDAGLWLIVGGSFFVGVIVVLVLRRRRRAAASIAIALTVFSAPPPADAAPAGDALAVATRDVAQRFADGAVFVPKPTQRILAIRTILTEVQTYLGTVELPARVIPDPNGSGFVQASVAGRLAPPPGGFPRLGTRVNAGDVLAYVQPAIGAADVTSQQQQARELDQQIAIVQRRLERWRTIANIVARQQIEEAELELAGLRIRRVNLDRATREPETLVAPVSGVIAAVQAIAGQIAEPSSVIFQIVDPARFWVEALSFEAHAINGSATGRFADRRTVSLVYRGSGLADRNQAIPIQFAIEGEARGLRAGQLLSVLASTNDQRRGIAVPRASVLRGPNGQSIVYEHATAERFFPREVRVELLDGQRVLVVSGIDPGRRIVTQGAELLNQIR